MLSRSFSIAVFATLLATAAVAGQTKHSLTRAAALKIAAKAAIAHGYDLSHFRLDTFGRGISPDGTEFWFVYLCKPVPPPGCQFMVTVNRSTGTTELIPGK